MAVGPMAVTRVPRRCAVVATLVVLAGAGCSSGGSDDAATTTTTTTTRPITTTQPTTTTALASGPSTTPPATTATTAAPVTAPSSATTTEATSLPAAPEEYTSDLVRAWGRGDRAAAEQYATGEVVSTLFGRADPGGPRWDLVGRCDTAMRRIYCTYRDPATGEKVTLGLASAEVGGDPLPPRVVAEVFFAGSG
ncbi:MAG: hypothetical protein HYX34_01455 [Actinobacteria bacterium]|nr:hypothetical protein [Actinomycetota bacterium]